MGRKADPSPTLELLQDPQKPTTELKQLGPEALATNTQRLSAVTTRQNTADDILANHKCWEPCVSLQEMAGQDYCTERGEAKEDNG